ncbi:uncharacterized protein BXZ73DRAFT_98547 [Epithele typhae]|uniref:uncharacterized protein n=1 Tax=Epithele typhae TaxID=378194 RepID=UPI00200858A6|nr:uncharacterized protein BXZ73DRAFT_98547 [Epithele typhae]KAH9940719.1 hypothetical protein BXZ73DRAFT_98547 [Epithele typhae]
MDSSPISVAPSPFDNPKADIILRTSDSVDFYVFSQVLIAASPVFESMFEFPQPPPDDQTLRIGRPTVTLTEDSKSIATVLKICYPIIKPTEWSLEEMEAGMRAALKFDMELPIAVLTDALEAAVQTRPLAVWAIACRINQENLALRAAQNLNRTPQTARSRRHPILRLNGLDGAEELEASCEGITAGDFYRLCEFDRHYIWSRDKYELDCPPFPLLTPPGSSTDPTASPTPSDESHIATTIAILADVPSPDVILRSSDNITFQAHRAVLTTSSHKLATEIAAQMDPSSLASTSDASSTSIALPSVSLDICGVVLATLVITCYDKHLNSPPILLTSPTHCVQVIKAAEAYGMMDTLSLLFRHWRLTAANAPLAAFCEAATANHAACAQEAARLAIHKPLAGQYVPEMELSGGFAYMKLLEYDEKCHHLLLKGLKTTRNALHLPLSEVPYVEAPSTSSAVAPPTESTPPLPSSASGASRTRRVRMTIGPVPAIFVSLRPNPARDDTRATWARCFVSDAFDQASQMGSEFAPPTVQSLLEGSLREDNASVGAATWCDKCQPLAKDMLKVTSDFDRLSRELDAVTIAL